MSPALVWVSGIARYLAFLRVSNYPDELYDNFLWVQEFTEALEPVPGSGAVVGLPTHSANLMAPGPEDPRALLFRGGVLVAFNLQFRNNDRRMVLYDHDSRRIVALRVEGMPLQRAEKNWMRVLACRAQSHARSSLLTSDSATRAAHANARARAPAHACTHAHALSIRAGPLCLTTSCTLFTSSIL
jgi:hypothetical protein